MNDLAIPIAQLILLGGFCLGLYRVANGNLKKKVDRGECHAAQKSIKVSIDAVKESIDKVDVNINRRFDDLKDRIENGKH